MSGTDGNPEYPDDRPLSPEPPHAHGHGYEHASIPDPPPEPEPVMSSEPAHAEPEKRRKRRGFRLSAPSMAFLKPSYWLGQERHEVLPDPPHHEASPAHVEHPGRPHAKAPAARFPFLGMKRETRVGIAAVVSFICLVAGLVSNRAKPVTLAIKTQDETVAKDEKLTPKPPADAPKPDLLPKGEKGAADPVSPPDSSRLPLPPDEKAKPADPSLPPPTPPVAPPGPDPSANLEPPTAAGMPSLPPPLGDPAPKPSKEEPKPADPPAGGTLDLPTFPNPAATETPAPAPAPAPKPEPTAPLAATPPEKPEPTAPLAATPPEKPEPTAPPPTAPPVVEPPPAPNPPPVLAPMPEVAEPVRKESPPRLETPPPSTPPAVVAAPAAAEALPSGWVVIPSGGRRVPGGVADRAPVEPTPPPVVVADGPRAREDDSAVDPVESALHRVKSGENFFTISRLYYRSGRYYKALHAANARQVPVITDLTVGMVIRVPPVEALDRSLVVAPSPVKAALGEEAPPSAVSRTSTRRSDPVDDLEQPSNPRNRAPKPEVETRDEPVRPSYTVKPYQTLRSIARDTLGDQDRDVEIRALNREVLGDLRNPTAGMKLILPSDAIIGGRGK